MMRCHSSSATRSSLGTGCEPRHRCGPEPKVRRHPGAALTSTGTEGPADTGEVREDVHIGCRAGRRAAGECGRAPDDRSRRSAPQRASGEQEPTGGPPADRGGPARRPRGLAGLNQYTLFRSIDSATAHVHAGLPSCGGRPVVRGRPQSAPGSCALVGAPELRQRSCVRSHRGLSEA